METYKCLSTSIDKPCGKQFTSQIGPTICPWCGSTSVEWVSFGKPSPEKKSLEVIQQEFMERMFNEDH